MHEMTIPLLRDNKTPEEIFNSMCNDLRAVCNRVKKTIRESTPANETAPNVEKTVIMPEIASTLRQRTSVINKLINNITDSNELDLDFPRFKNEAIMSLPIMMNEETNSSVRIAETLDRLKSENDDYLQLLSKTEELLTEIEETEICVNTNEKLEIVHRKAKEELKEVQKDLADVIEVLFVDEETSHNMYALLEELVKRSQSSRDEDEWYEPTGDDIQPLVMMLCQAGVLLVNPQNNKQVKLIM